MATTARPRAAAVENSSVAIGLGAGCAHRRGRVCSWGEVRTRHRGIRRACRSTCGSWRRENEGRLPFCVHPAHFSARRPDWRRWVPSYFALVTKVEVRTLFLIYWLARCGKTCARSTGARVVRASGSRTETATAQLFTDSPYPRAAGDVRLE